MTQQRYPLDWPVGYPRTQNPKRSAFKNPTLGSTVQSIVAEVNRLVGYPWNRYNEKVIISTNIPLKNDGYPRADYFKSIIRDKGAAVYFKKGSNDVVLCCDRYDTVESNLHAIWKTIEALRAIERWGVSDFLDRSFSGFKALPEKSGTRQWWEVLGFNETPVNFMHVQTHYRGLAKSRHPDSGGTIDEFQELQTAYDKAKKYFNV